MEKANPRCPTCGKLMIREHGGITYTSYPPQWDERWKCMGDGHATDWERMRGKTQEQTQLNEWERLNGRG